MAIVHAESSPDRSAVAVHRQRGMPNRAVAPRSARRIHTAFLSMIAFAMSVSLGCAHERGDCSFVANGCFDPPPLATVSFSSEPPEPRDDGPASAAPSAPKPSAAESKDLSQPVDSASACAPAHAANAPCASIAADGCACSTNYRPVWGDLGIRLFPYGDHVGSNGEEFNQLFSLDMDFNIWVWQPWDWYLFSDMRFWGQKAARGITNANQGSFDFSKREFDFSAGAAWNYYGSLEARTFAYSFNNLNRGNSPTAPSGFNDGFGLENRYYIGSEYSKLGTPDYDVARSSFVSLGYYPSKSMVDGLGKQFRPGAFARLYLTWEIFGPRCYLFTDDQFILDRAGSPTLFTTDSGMAVRPFVRVPRLEFRVGTEDTIELLGSDSETSVYVSVYYIF